MSATEAFEEGVYRLFEKNGILITAAFVLLGLISGLIASGFVPESATMLSGPTIAMFLAVVIGAILLNSVVSIAAIRTFASDETEMIPSENFQRRIGYVVMNWFAGIISVAGILMGWALAVFLPVGFFVFLSVQFVGGTVGAGMAAVLAFLGAVALLVGAVYLILSFFFVNAIIAVEDSFFIEALQRSWDLSQGQKWELFGISLVFAIIQSVLTGAATILPDNTLYLTVVQIALALQATAFLAVQTRAYVQVAE